MTTKVGTRAVLRRVEPGMRDKCPGCGDIVMFRAWKQGRRALKVVANVYVDGRWDRVEHFHPECYVDAGEPHGTPA